MELIPEIIEVKISDALYPSLLKEITDAPKQLFVMGDPKILANFSLAIVGTRKPSDYGIQSAGYFARSCAGNFSIVSGLAYGIDTVALSEALTVGGQPVIAVIGSGLDQKSFYPQSNYKLALDIVASGGAVISEYPVGAGPMKHHFPARNRIIAGLSKGVLVIEAGEGSGALITANLALDYNREVMALAGNIFLPQAMGSNQLIKEGARLITSREDVFDALGIDPQIVVAKSEDNLVESDSLESKIVAILNEKAMHADEIALALSLDSAKVSSTLTLMEIKGEIKLVGAGKFARLR
jgi:DNA processing protein